MNIIYADNNATTAVAPEVSRRWPFFTRLLQSQFDVRAGPADGAACQARAEIARHFGLADANRFSSPAAPRRATTRRSSAQSRPIRRRHVITTAVEHPAVLEVCKELAARRLHVTFLGVDGHGNLDTGEFIRALRPDTLLVTIMHANNETGVIFPSSSSPG